MKWFVILLLLLASVLGCIGFLARPGAEASPDAIITVDSTADNEDRDGVITLREAILLATGDLDKGALDSGEADNVSGSPGPGEADTIVFDAGVFPPDGPEAINLGWPLPPLHTGNDTVDASSAGVILDGVNHWFDCLDITSNGNSVKGLQLHDCNCGVRIHGDVQNNTIGGSTEADRNVMTNSDTGVCIQDPGTSNNVVIGNYIGTDPSGSDAVSNFVGVSIRAGAHDNTVGGDSEGERNVISGNDWNGVTIQDGGTNNNVVIGNYIGTDATAEQPEGGHPIPNGEGVHIGSGAQGNVIGGDSEGERNVISGNTWSGVWIGDSGTNGNVVIGNYIGTDATGYNAMGNGDGVGIWGGPQNNTVGGTSEGERNVISGNSRSGVWIGGDGTNNNVVSGNYIGTDATGTGWMGNNGVGISISHGAQNNTIGGGSPGERNVISANGQDGVSIGGPGTNSNVVIGNYIGTDASGSGGMGNQRGVWVGDFAQNNTIGGDSEGERNVISANDWEGVLIWGWGAIGNEVKGNYIGTDASGTSGMGNGNSGVTINGGAQNNTVGGSGAGEGNVISANGGNGVGIADDGTNSNVVIGNYIGTDASGTSAMGNNGVGVSIGNGAQNNTIGGSSPGERNVISANQFEGVSIGETGTNSNVVIGNYIGTDVTGSDWLGNGREGVWIGNAAQWNVIGGSTEGERNVISANNWNGVNIWGWGANNNVVRGNYIGTDASGTIPLGNSGGGVSISGGAQNNRIGGGGPGEGNLISGNWNQGIWIGNGDTNYNVVEGNYIGTDASGTIALPNDGGVSINDRAQNNTIGGSGPGEGNVISGNNWDGIWIGNGDTNYNVVEGNYIGTDASGTAAIPNDNGVNVNDGAQNNTIGGASPSQRNVISGNWNQGIWIGNGGTNYNVVQGNYVGTDASGSAAIPNGGGVAISSGAQNNTIGGTSPGEGNVISGNTWDGIWIGHGDTNYNAVQGNRIGTDPSGTAALPNSTGVNICCGAEENTIGGSTPEERNIISGNFGDGVSIPGGGHNRVSGNYIGTDVNGTGALPNNNGVSMGDGAYENTIGGSGPGEGNLISGNNRVGVWIDWYSNNNAVKGNYVGTDASGMAALPNQSHGTTLINGAYWNQIGGPAPEERNIISGNNGIGVEIWMEGTRENLIEGNYIGLNAAGDPLGNLYTGVQIYNGAGNNTVRGNVISDNGGSGVAVEGMLYRLSGSPTETTPIAIDNQLEVLVNGQTVSLESLSPGGGSVQAPHFQAMRGDTLEVRASSTDDECGSIGPVWLTHIGTEDSVQLTAGVEDCGPDGLFWSTTYAIDVPEYYWIAGGNTIEGNRIGTNVAGDTAIPNNGPGVELGRGSDRTVVGAGPPKGGASSGGAMGVYQASGGDSANLISGNNGDGVRILESWNNHIGANHIGTDLSGTLALPNHGPGVHMLQGASSNTVLGNVIAGNEGDGVQLEQDNTDWNRVIGNHIGVDASGTAALANWGNGVTIEQGASGNSIGGIEEWERNVITGNQGWGVVIQSGAESNSVSYNYIGLDAAGMPGLPSKGVAIINGSSYNSVYGNVISDNPGSAITVGALTYGLNGSETEPMAIDLDDRLEILVNGQTVFVGDADGGQIWVPPFSAVPGDTIEVRASTTDGSGSIGPVWLFHQGSGEHVQLTAGAAGGSGTFWTTGPLTLDFPTEGWITEGTWISDNLIGTDPSGETPAPNDGHGVDIWGFSEHAYVHYNTIAFNSGDGVHVDTSTGNSIRANSIHSNAGKGIENINGGNNELLPPVLTGGGSVTGLACPYCWVDIFSDGEDEGAVYEGSTMVAADGTFVFPGTPSGPYITATVMDGEANTSEFSAPIVPVVVRMGSGSAPPGNSVTLTLDVVNIPDPGLGAFTIDISYDSAIVTPTAFAAGPALDNVDCNLAYATNTVRCSGLRAAAGAVGDVALVNLTFEVDAGAVLGAQSPLTVGVVELVDVDGYDIGAGTQDGTITAGLCGDVNCDGVVNVVDALFILQYEVGLRDGSDQCPAPSGHLYLPACDVNCDAACNVIDALFVLQYEVGLRPELCVCGEP
jgi:hypothetical protein